MLQQVSRLYFRGLPYVLSLTTGTGIGLGIGDRNVDFGRLFGNVGIGMLVGVTYPLSFPLLAKRYLEKNYFK